eukprot:TRINITY_DN263_c0_g1_i1.p1 TRINITY_DN263_c0_g1~~TRINITY_DN263_c0_g1_i1.p1  ORF type:complete len:198 (-),score=51.05 TRINITY_DN263_c0_g1_i1:26-562(-)
MEIDEEDLLPKKVEILNDTNEPSCATFILRDEDHTLGNAIRYVLVKNKDVEFAGYSIPHPMDPVLNLRVQTKRDESIYTEEGADSWVLSVLKDRKSANLLKGTFGDALINIPEASLRSKGLSEEQTHQILTERNQLKAIPATTVFAQSLDQLTGAFEHILHTFNEALEQYNNTDPMAN